MYADMLNDKTDFDNLKDIYKKIHEIFSNVKSQDDISIEELVDLYSHDDAFLNDLSYIRDSLSEIAYMLASIESLENEFYNFLTIKRMIDYLLNDIKLFLIHLRFIEKLLFNFFNLIHQKLLKNDEYENEYVSFLTFLNNQKDFFYTKVYIYSGEFEDTIIEINNILWG